MVSMIYNIFVGWILYTLQLHRIPFLHHDSSNESNIASQKLWPWMHIYIMREYAIYFGTVVSSNKLLSKNSSAYWHNSNDVNMAEEEYVVLHCHPGQIHEFPNILCSGIIATSHLLNHTNRKQMKLCYKWSWWEKIFSTMKQNVIQI